MKNNIVFITMFAVAQLSCSSAAAQSSTSQSPSSSENPISTASEKRVPLLDSSNVKVQSSYHFNVSAPNEVVNLAKGTIASSSHFVGVGTGFGCTSTMIGPNVLVTAAHCIDGGGTPAIVKNVEFRPRYYTGTDLLYKCTMHPTYKKAKYAYTAPRTSHDIALCLLSNPQDLRPGRSNIFEVVDLQTKPVEKNNILMTGYGCFDVKTVQMSSGRWRGVTSGSGDGYFRVGDAVISEDNAESFRQNNLNLQAIFESHSKPADNSGKLCSGDSGGPVFRGVSVNSPNSSRRVIAVNSAVTSNIAARSSEVNIISLLTDFNEPTISNFFNDFLRINSGAKICGINIAPGQSRCRL